MSFDNLIKIKEWILVSLSLILQYAKEEILKLYHFQLNGLWKI